MSSPQYALSIDYSVTVGGLTLNHNHRVRVAIADASVPPTIGDAPADINLETNGTGLGVGSATLASAVAEYLNVFCDLFTADMNVQNASLQFYEFGMKSAGVYVSPINLGENIYSAVTQGTNTGATVASSQRIYTFFDSRGRVSKLSLLEGRFIGDDQRGFGDLGVADQAYVGYITGANGVLKGSDNSTMLSLRLASTGQNERVWRNRNRA